MRRFLLTLALAVAVGAPTTAVSKTTAIAWQPWSAGVFAQARTTQRYVLLDLGAVWCHWCHVMERETYADAEVARLVGARYLAVHADQDANPDLAARYGDWGWPATIILAPDGTELVKRRGYIPPAQMASLLQAVIDDPTPGPSVQATTVNSGDGSALDGTSRAKLSAAIDEAWDDTNAGWGSGQKFLHAQAIEWLLTLAARGDPVATDRARRTLDASLALLDPVAGGVYQYSDAPDWHSPHYEKIMSYQADDLRLYLLAWERFGTPAYLEAAQAIARYLRSTLRAPDGSFYTSQDADLSATVSGHDWYALDGAGRRKLGAPRVDRHAYARDNGWAITALCALYDATGDDSALRDARGAALWALRERSLAGGGFRHDQRDTVPQLADNLAMAQALLALYRSTGDTNWLRRSVATLHFIDGRLRDPLGGYDAAPRPPRAVGVFAKPVRTLDDNLALGRLANLVAHYSGDAGASAISRHAERYFAAPATVGSGLFLPGLLLAEEELAREPVHITVVGASGDLRSHALRAAALAYPSLYSRVEFWDRALGPLPNADVKYPHLRQPAAFACSAGACSTPVFEADRLAAAVDRVSRIALTSP